MKVNKTRIHAIISNFGLIDFIISVNDFLNEKPIPYSSIKNGIPKMAIDTRYGMKNDPPPLE